LFPKLFSNQVILIFSCEKTFILTGVNLPSPSTDRIERQVQLKEVVQAVLLKLDPALSCHKITYVRVIKSPKPSILEVECETIDSSRAIRSRFGQAIKTKSLSDDFRGISITNTTTHSTRVRIAILKV
jgi:hypothetical protein